MISGGVALLHVCGNRYLLVCLFTQLLLTFVTLFQHLSRQFSAVTSGDWLVYEITSRRYKWPSYNSVATEVLSSLIPILLFVNAVILPMVKHSLELNFYSYDLSTH